MQAPFANEIHDIIKDLNYNTNNINDVILYKPFKIFQAFGIVKHALYYNNNNFLLYNFIVILIICFITYNVNLSKLKKILLFSILLLLWFLYLLIRRWE